MNKFVDLLKRFQRDERGAFLALFGVLAVVFIATAGATVDFTSVQNARTRAQVALDAAALALQPDVYSGTYTAAQAKTLANDLMVNRIGDTKIVASVLSAVPNTEKTTLTLTAKLTVPLYFVSLIGIKEMSMNIVSQSTRGAMDLEVSVALDVTGSMKTDDKIDALILAANDMVDILVLDQQTPTYSKVALVPYSMGVNVGTYANAVRGTPIGPQVVTSAAWQSGSSATITNRGITKANPASVTTSVAHGFSNGDTVWISGIANANNASGWTNLNDEKYVITVQNATQFTLNNTSTNSYNTSGNPNYNTNIGGTVRKCLNADCEVVITNAGHGLTNNEQIFFTGVGGMTFLNSSNNDIEDEDPDYYTAVNVQPNTFDLNGVVGPEEPAWTSGGQFSCVRYGCQYFRFTSASGNRTNLHKISTCVTERTTAPYQYTDTAPATAPVGPNYPSTDNNCLTNQIVPLSDSKTTLHAAINALKADGSTAGQIGTAWAWYMLSPSFASLWPTASKPAAYKKANLMKVLILMTDGSFNSVYCNGVIAADSTTGSGDGKDHINCNAQNGNPFQQTKNLCDGIKFENRILVYTVGFDIADQTNEKDMLSYCATDANKFKLASDAEGLRKVFREIAQDIAQLRLSE